MKSILKYAGFTLLFFASYLVFISFSNENKLLASVDKIAEYYNKNKGDSIPSISSGTVSNGSLKHGKLIPFYGDNYQYFDSWSYLQGRAFLNGSVLATVLKTYSILSVKSPYQQYRVMECSHENGGKLYPHRTHQNGLSVDFMMPLMKAGKPYYELDDKGVKHYLLDFNDEGSYEKDVSISIDFERVAQHVLILDQQARKQGLKITKVIIKIELKDELFNCVSGKLLKNSGIYIVQGLTPKINKLHDDHYHIDFGPI